MWSLLKGALEAILAAIWGAFEWVLNNFWDNILVPVIDWLFQWVADVWAWLIGKVPVLLDGLIDLAGSLGLDWDKQGMIDALDGVAGLYEGLNWFVPVTWILVLWVNTLCVRMAILLIRYVIGYIPTIEG